MSEAAMEIGMNAPTEEALKLRRLLPDGSLPIVAKGEKEDQVGRMAQARAGKG